MVEEANEKNLKMSALQQGGLYPANFDGTIRF
jgi:hypothetical protein